MKLIDYIKPYFENNPKLQVLFFFDADSSHEEDIKDLMKQESIIRVKIAHEDWFTQKVWLQENRTTSPKLLYYPGRKPPLTQSDREAFGLMGELLANEELEIDDAAIIIQELKLKVSMKPLILKYLSELKKENVKTALRGLQVSNMISEQDIQKGVLGVILNAKTIENWTKIMMRLVDFSLDEFAVEWNKRYTRIQNANLLEALNEKIKMYYGTVLVTGSHEELKKLALRVKYNMITQGLDLHDTDPYGAYKILNASVLLNLEQIRISLSDKSKVSESFIEAMKQNGENIKESQLVECYGYKASFGHYNTALRLGLLSAIIQDYLKEGKDVKDALLILKQSTSESNALNDIIEFLLHGIRLSELIQSYHSFSFDNNPKTFVEKYIGSEAHKEHYSKIDFLYRKSLYYFSKMDLSAFEDHFKTLYEELDERLNLLKKNIESKYLTLAYDLNASWMKSLKAYGFDYKKIKKESTTGFALQYDFFENNVVKLTNKVAVIISDGLRYEVAEEFVELMQQKKGNLKHELGWNLASIPSTTCFGMANLLPSKEGKYLGKGGIELDGINTNGISNRAKILELSQKSTGRSTRAVSAQDVLKNNAKDNRALFKANIVYVYHDEIDSMSHSTGHEYHAIEGSETAISDLTKLVTKILGSNVTKVIITADHGFLYRGSKIEEQDKIAWPSIDCTLEQGARHTVINDRIAELEQGMAFDLSCTTKYKEDYQVHTPMSTNRLKGRGVTYMYTHGGASLQELVVPVLTISSLSDKATSAQEKVNLQLVDQKLSVKSNVLKGIQILQLESISATKLKRTVKVGLYEGKQLVSNIKTLEFNLIDKDPTDRIITTSLMLQTKTSGSLLHMRVYDVDDQLNPLIDVTVKNNTLIERDFDL